VGFLYVKTGTKLLPLINGGSQDSGIRGGTENIAGIAAMAVALKNSVIFMQKTTKRLNRLTESFYDILNQSGVEYIINGNREMRLAGHISVSFRNKSGEALLRQLDLKKICVSTGSACDSTRTEISHVLKAIRLPEELAEGTLRITLGRDNTLDEVRKIADCLIKALNR
jgi:cysteine desulfurase